MSILLFSCVSEVDDIFDDSAANRVNKAISEYSEILTAPKNGWILEYYAEGNRTDKIGGYNMFIKFNEDGTATIASDYSSGKYKPGTKMESEYEVRQDQIIMLTFNTYNPILHYYSEPHGSSDVNGFQGDYEFLFREISNEEIIFEGKKIKIKMRMTPVPDEVDPDALLMDLYKVRAQSNFGYFQLVVNEEIKGTVENRTIFVASMRTCENSLFTINTEESTIKENVIYTSKGIKFYKPITIEGEEVSTLTWDTSENAFIADNTRAVIKFKASLPEGYKSYEYFLGNFSFQSSGGNRDIQIEEKSYGIDYRIVGLFDGLEPIFTYDKDLGTIAFKGHMVKPFENNYVALLPWDSKAGYFNRSTTIGGNFIQDISVDGKFDMQDNGVWGTYECNSLILWVVDSNWGSVGQYQETSPDRLAGPISITKK